MKASAQRARLKRLEQANARRGATEGGFPTMLQIFEKEPMTQAQGQALRDWLLERGFTERPDGKLDDSQWRAELKAREARDKRWRAFMATSAERPCWQPFLELEAARDRDADWPRLSGWLLAAGMSVPKSGRGDARRARSN